MKDLGMPPESLRNLIEFTEPIAAPDVPRMPESDGRIIGLNYKREIDEQTPSWCYPWMPSISNAKRIDAEAKSAKEKKAKEEQNNSDDENMQSEEENPPSAPGGARGPDHQYPQLGVKKDCLLFFSLSDFVSFLIPIISNTLRPTYPATPPLQ